MANVQMQARSSTDGQLYTWVSAGPDWAGAGFPGPGSAQEPAVSMEPAGTPGSLGPQGPQGPQGAGGAAGGSGPQGAQGSTGTSALSGIVDVATTTLTLVRATHNGKILRFTNAAGCTVTYNTGVFSDGDVVYLEQGAVGQVVFAGTGSIHKPASKLAKTAELNALAAIFFWNSGADGTLGGALEAA